MYHAVFRVDLLDLINLTGAYPGGILVGVGEMWKSRTTAMRSWLAALSHPDGQIAFFNDAAFDVAAVPEQIESYASRLGLPSRKSEAATVTHLQDSG